MGELAEFRIYLSSTIEDLVAERDEAIKIISKYGVVKDSYRASEKGTVATCIRDVRGCHLYIGILGQRYGWIPEEDNPNAKSITEMEYEACQGGDHRIDRLIFTRTTSPDKFSDAISHPVTAERMKKFRDRAGSDQQDWKFNDIGDFKTRLTEAVMNARAAFHRKQTIGQAIFDTRKVWKSTLRPVTLLGVTGTDDGLSKLVVSNGAMTFKGFSPTADDSALQVDQAVQKSQLCVVMVTPSSLQRMTEPTSCPRVSRLMNTLRQRLGLVVILCVDVDPINLPSAWQPFKSVCIQSTRLEQSPQVTVHTIYDQLLNIATLTNEPRLALGCLVIAPTQNEAEALVKGDSTIFAGFDDTEIREQRRNQFAQLAKAARTIYPDWPEGAYGTERKDWRCFGPTSHTVTEVINDAIRSINKSLRGSRERQLLHDTEIIVRHYNLDEYLCDIDESRRMILNVRDRGCLFVVDEVALLDPVLRAASDELLSASRSAIVSIGPCDPTHMPIRKLLGEFSFLRVGSIVNRFKAERDPQCELALNSEERVQRWLSMAIPKLVVETDGLASQPRLVEHAGELFEQDE